MNKFGIVLALSAGLIQAQDAREIVTEVQRRARAESQRYEGSLRVIDSGGRVTDKSWQYDRLGSHGNSKAILRFTSPPEVRGVKLLVLNHPDRASDQWMWTPALARERRIALQDRSTRFFGTDFSFEDLEERDVEHYDYRLLGQETLEGHLCWRLEARPRKGKSSQYTRSLLWVRQDIYVFVQVENFVDNQLARRLKYGDFERVAGIWTGRRLEMHDVRRNSRTILTFDKLDYNLPMQEETFTLQALRRGL